MQDTDRCICMIDVPALLKTTTSVQQNDMVE